jgi:hypothetical protein
MTMQSPLSPAADMLPHWFWAAMCPATDIGWLEYLVGTPVEMLQAPPRTSRPGVLDAGGPRL